MRRFPVQGRGSNGEPRRARAMEAERTKGPAQSIRECESWLEDCAGVEGLVLKLRCFSAVVRRCEFSQCLKCEGLGEDIQ